MKAVCALAVLFYLTGCGVTGGTRSNPLIGNTASQNTVTVSVSPSTATVVIGQTTQFSATVKDTSNTAVQWAVNGIAGGNSTVGTILASGVYTAPGRVPSSAISVSAASMADASKSASASVNVMGYGGVLSWHSDMAISGQNLKESTLTPSNVNPTLFGKLTSYPLDDQAFAQPLYVAGVLFPGAGQHNAVYVATESNTMYALDADGTASAPFWKKSLMPRAATPVDGTKTGGGAGGPITPRVGITGTPVIDGSSGTLFVVSVTQESSGQVQRLHALDITTGNEKFGGPVVIQATVPGTGVGSQHGQIAFDPTLQLQRSALSLINGVVYIEWASYQDWGNYHGWIMGYDASNLKQLRVWNATPNGRGGAVWMAGAPASADSSGNLYVVTGNGTFDANTGGKDYGDSLIKLTPNGTFSISDYFTPFDQANLSANDIDVGSSGLTLLFNQPGPNANLGITAGKAGKIYVVDLNNMGKFQAGSDSQIVQSIPNALGSPQQTSDNNYSTAVYWNGNVYYIGNMDVVRQFQLSNGRLSGSPVDVGLSAYGYPGANMSVSSNGSGNGILWSIEASGQNVLHAYDANDISNELYNSDQNSSGRDHFGTAIRFTVPMVATGKVYVGGQTQLAIFGLL